MTNSVWAPAARPDGDERRCARRAFRAHAWRLVLGSLGLAFVCAALALAGTFIP